MTREHFIELVRMEQEGLRKFLLVLCSGDSMLADDLAQEALVKAYVASGSYRPLCKFSTWLYRIAYNTFIDFKRRRTPVFVDVEEADIIASESEKKDYRPLYEAIAGLSARERAVITLFYLEDRQVREIAAILGIPAGTVKSDLSRGREHLRKKVKI